jgi:phospholipid/cholesterol/gamma-HCH transport system substrate-binding protein
LYWLAWFGHNANSVASTEDPNGAVLRGLTLLSCTSLTAQPALADLLKVTLGPTGPCAGGQR